jgi:hypothetical protein
MSAERSGKSHATAWALSILAVPVLYLLSVSPLAILARGTPRTPPPGWLTLYGRPYVWIWQHTWLGRPLEAYDRWWIELVGWNPGR